MLLYVLHFRELSGKELVAELVHAFLLPEVDRRAMKEKGK